MFSSFSESRLQPASVTQHKMDSTIKSVEVVTAAHLFYACSHSFSLAGVVVDIFGIKVISLLLSPLSPL